MLATRSISPAFVLFCWKTSKKFLLPFEGKKKPDFDSRHSKMFGVNLPQIIFPQFALLLLSIKFS